MNRSTTAVIAAVIVSVVVVVGVVAVFSAADLSPVAVRVNGDEVSQQQLNSELKGFADSTFFAQPYAQAQPPAAFKVSDGALSSLASAQWLGYRIENSLVEQALARRNISVTQKDLDAARKALVGQGVLDGMSDTSSDQITRLQASLTKLVKVTGSATAARTALQKAARKAHVTIDERYGSWDPKKLGVCPRVGCRLAVSVLPPAQS
jgi:SurA N-terminal domain